MKIGVITFHRAQNIGANLQAYALNQFINQNIGECEIIDYYPNNQTAHKNRGRRLLSNFKTHIFYNSSRVRRAFAKFQTENYILSSKTYYGDADIKKNPPQYDILISGSDQIFNTTLSGESKAYYLCFDNIAKKISYASSFGRDSISALEKKLIQTELVKFDKISVRETSAGLIIKEQIGVECEVVLDPVFLLSKEQWNKMCSKLDIDQKYIFVYAMEVSTNLLMTVNEVKRMYKLPTIVVYGCKENHIIDGFEIYDCGPKEFLTYIKNACIVITNSFHGTALSMIFEKKYICVAHSTRNVRLQNIMMLADCEPKLTYKPILGGLNKYITNGAESMRTLKPHIKKSKKYLLNVLQK